MDEDTSDSWIRRAKFSHTVCHRTVLSRSGSLPSRNSGLKSGPPEAASLNRSSIAKVSQVQRNFIPNNQRSMSPLPETFVPQTFKEARHERKRFSTPGPQRKKQDKKIMGKLLNKDSQEIKISNPKSPIKHLASMKLGGKSTNCKESGWTKYFDHGGGRVTAVETAEEWTVDLSKLSLGRCFAYGAHSRLYHGEYDEKPVAVKIIRVPDDDENGTLASRLEKQFIREVTLLSRLHHPNVIKFIAACRQPSVYCVITEYLSKGSLRAYLRKLEGKTVSLQKLIVFALDIARGMEYIHSQGVVHRDLKPENVLINDDGHLSIVDFGIACEEEYCNLLADDPGTFRWMAPEMIKRKSHGRKVDVYSFGLMLWEMLTGTTPYDDMTPIQAAFAVVNKNSRPVIPSNCPPDMRYLIERCWSLHSDKRPEFRQIIKVLEQFESSLAHDGTLTMTQNVLSQDNKSGPLHWMQKRGSVHQPSDSVHQHSGSLRQHSGPLHQPSSFVPKPKFA